MPYPQLDTYEYKSPSYVLRDRGESTVDLTAHAGLRRYSYDSAKRCYRSHAPAKDSVNMLFAGDLLCQENMISRHQTKDGSYDFSLCFDYVRPLLQSTDLAVGNLETPISRTAPYRGEILTHEGPFFCNAPLEYLEALSGAGFDMLTTANNHTLDAGLRGMLETIDNTNAMGFIQTGTFKENGPKYVIVDVCGIKVGFTAFSTSYNTMEKNLTPDGRTHLLNTYTQSRAASVLKAMRKQGAEYTICFPHWGEEYTAKITQTQRSIAEYLTELGYDLVVGAHSHTIQKFEIINGKPVLFSLGNLITHLNTVGDTECEYTILLSLTLKRTAEGLASELAAVPCKILKKHSGIPYTVLPVVESLNLIYKNIPSLTKTVAVARKRLGNRLSVNLNYPVTPEAVQAFRERQTGLREAVSRLVPTPPAISLPKFRPPVPFKRAEDAFDHYVQEAGGLYTVWEDHAELVQFQAGNTVVKIKPTVEDKPVTVVRNSTGNTSSRVIYLGKYTQTVGSGMFRGFSQLESVRFFDNLTAIESEAFRDCGKLTGLTLPRSLREIGSEAFRDCPQLMSIKIPGSVTSIGEDAFTGCPLLTVYCEEGTAAHHYAQAHGIPVKFMPLPADPNAPADPPAENAPAANEKERTSSPMGYTIQFTVQQVCDILDVKLPKEYRHIANDTLTNLVYTPRFLTEGSALFLAGKKPGEKEERLAKAIEEKAKIVFCSKLCKDFPRLNEIPHVFVKSPFEAVVRLCAEIRKNMGLNIIGVTGSVGKTTTKDFIFSVLEQDKAAVKSVGNQNIIGPIFNTMQKIPEGTKYLVQEFGIDIPGAMPKTAGACGPCAGVITTISDPHLDAFGSKENILAEKLKLITQTPDGCPGFLNYDNELLRSVRLENHPIVSYAVDNRDADYYADNIEVHEGYMTFDIIHGDRRTPVRVNANGRYNVGNAVVAMAVGEWFGVPLDKIVTGIANYRSEGIRQNLTNVGGYKLFIDCYNTAPVSLLGAVEVLEKLSVEPGGKRVAVLGDIVRLGTEEKRLHRETGEKIGKSNLDLALCFGNENAKIMADAIRAGGTAALYTGDRDELNMWMRGLITRKDITLIKGPVARLLSRSIDQVWGTSLHFVSEHFDWVTRGDYRAKLIYEKEDHNRKMAALAQYNGSAAEVEVPGQVDGVDVFSVCTKCFFKNVDLKSVVIPAPIFNIGAGAFRGCVNLSRVQLPSTLMVISDKAFRFCSSLDEIVIPQGVIEIGSEAFAECRRLKRVVLPASVGHIGENAFQNCGKVKLVCPAGSYAARYAKDHGIPHTTRQGK